MTIISITRQILQYAIYYYQHQSYIFTLYFNIHSVSNQTICVQDFALVLAVAWWQQHAVWHCPTQTHSLACCHCVMQDTCYLGWTQESPNNQNSKEEDDTFALMALCNQVINHFTPISFTLCSPRPIADWVCPYQGEQMATCKAQIADRLVEFTSCSIGSRMYNLHSYLNQLTPLLHLHIHRRDASWTCCCSAGIVGSDCVPDMASTYIV